MTESSSADQSPPPVDDHKYGKYIVGIFLCLAVGIVPMALRAKKQPFLPDSVFVEKLQQKPVYDLVLVGNSRVYRDMSPKVISENIGKKVYNFGFSNLQMDSAVLSRAEQLLNPNGAKEMLLGINVNALSGQSLDGYRSVRGLNGIEQKNVMLFAPYEKYFRLGDAESATQKPDHLGFVWSMTKHADETIQKGRVMSGKTIATFKPQALADVANWVKSARARGIKVYATVPPIPEITSKAENEVGHYDPDLVRKTLQDAGAEWIDVPGTFQTYDGSHLLGPEAEKYSLELSKKLGGVVH